MIKQLTSRYLPVFVWMGIIFTFSSQTELPVQGTYTEDFVTKKIAHVLEYAILQLLMYRAVGQKDPARSFYYSLIFAFSDEIHQLFTPTRTGKLLDVAIDSIGLITACFAIIKLKLWNSYLLVIPSKKRKK